ncbi:MAG: FMN-binding protein [Treponema sp.]|jgi:uncharacterized protein with FMN-binding domain|nr:FMN-binding protein [Treponema sp.]
MKIFFVLFIITLLTLSCKSNSFAEIKASLPDMSEKSDGSYRGSYVLSGSPVKVVLDVTIQNKNIVAINIIDHFCSPIGKKAEKITGKIIEQQSLNVDVISGATGSSKAILKAVENALQ